MRDVNTVVATGGLTRDPELRTTQSGTNILTFSMAIGDSRKNQQTGEWEEFAHFADVVMFGSRAEWLSQHLRKGMRVCVSGSLRFSSWEKDGQRRSKLEIAADNVVLPPRQRDAGQQQPQQTYQQQRGYQPQQTYQQQTQQVTVDQRPMQQVEEFSDIPF